MRRALALLIAALGLAGAVSAGAAPAPSANLIAYLHGKRLPSDPRLQRGDAVRVVVTGFARSAPVQVRLGGTVSTSSRTADGNGALDYVYVVPPTLPDGSYVLTFVGPGPQRGDPVPSSGTMNDDGVIVVAPNGGFFPFRINVAEPSTSPPPPTASVSATATQRAGGGGRLPNTGQDLLTPLLIAIGALLAGAVAVGLGLSPRRGRRELGQ